VLASVFVVLVALDILQGFYRTTGFELDDVVATVLSGMLLLITSVYLIQSRRRRAQE
jgi:hypothetical protein